MIKINPEKEKQLTFSLNLEGASFQKVKSFFNMDLGRFEIRLPMVMEGGKAIVVIPALKAFKDFLPENINVSVMTLVEDKFFEPFNSVMEVEKLTEVKVAVVEDEDVVEGKDEIEETHHESYGSDGGEKKKKKKKKKKDVEEAEEFTELSDEEKRKQDERKRKKMSRLKMSLEDEKEIPKPPKKFKSKFAKALIGL